MYHLNITGQLFYLYKCIFWDVPEKQLVGSCAGCALASTEAQPIGRTVQQQIASLLLFAAVGDSAKKGPAPS